MGQYYKPSILKKNWRTANNAVKVTLSSYDFDNGAKLMEHSYVGNEFVGAVCNLLSRPEYFGLPFVWSGDYADAAPTRTGMHQIYEDALGYIYGKHDKKTKAYSALLKTIPSYEEMEKEGFGGYIVNLTKKEYVKIPNKTKGKLTVHPLPLLTADGNGLGGGDYRIEDERVGSWKFDKIGVTKDIKPYKDFKEVYGFFELDY